jgi:hypothetical protein
VLTVLMLVLAVLLVVVVVRLLSVASQAKAKRCVLHVNTMYIAIPDYDCYTYDDSASCIGYWASQQRYTLLHIALQKLFAGQCYCECTLW